EELPGKRGFDQLPYRVMNQRIDEGLATDERLHRTGKHPYKIGVEHHKAAPRSVLLDLRSQDNGTLQRTRDIQRRHPELLTQGMHCLIITHRRSQNLYGLLPKERAQGRLVRLSDNTHMTAEGKAEQRVQRH